MGSEISSITALIAWRASPVPARKTQFLSIGMDAACEGSAHGLPPLLTKKVPCPPNGTATPPCQDVPQRGCAPGQHLGSQFAPLTKSWRRGNIWERNTFLRTTPSTLPRPDAACAPCARFEACQVTCAATPGHPRHVSAKDAKSALGGESGARRGSNL